MSEETPHVVILGGGPGGAYAAQKLDKLKECRVTLVDTKGFCEYVPGTPMMVAGTRPDGSFDALVDEATVPHTRYVKNGEVVVGRVEAVSDDFKSVTLVGGRKIEADYLVVATGTAYEAPWKVPVDVRLDDVDAYKAYLREKRATVEEAKSVLVIGGGAVGVEVAAEVAVSFPDKKVALVSSSDALLPEQNAKLGARALDFFGTKENVTVLAGERCERGDDGAYTTSVTGTRVEADLVFVCYGIRPNSGYLPAAALDGRGFVRVDQETLQVEGHAHALAVGDVANIAAFSKTTKSAMEHGPHAAKVVEALIKGKAVPKIGSEPPGFITALGPGSGVADLGFITLTGWTSGGSAIAGFIKTKVPGKVAGGLV